MNVVANIDTTPTNNSKKKHNFDELIRTSDNWKLFDVPTEVFRRFETGRNKYERWSKYLDQEDDNQRSICDFAKRNPSKTIVLRDSTNGVLRQIRRRSNCG